MELSDLQVEPTGSVIGAKVSGINLKNEVSQAVLMELRGLLDQYAVLIFPQQYLSPDEFVRAGRIFGSLLPQQLKKYVLKDQPLVGYNSTSDLPRKNGKLHVRGENYHTDHSNFIEPPRATALVAVEIPEIGGDTQFVDTRLAYDNLSSELKEISTHLFSKHVHQSSRSPRELTKLTQEDLAKIPQTIQPLVIRHPNSGRAALYLNTGRMEGIEGMDDDGAYELIDALYSHAIQQEFEYRHVWSKGEMVIWDNRSVMHQANADYDPEKSRYLYRIMIEGPPIEAFTKNTLKD
ncbi:TauD/TfdA family dioxygenase [Litorivicinus sp.]|jgi:taurine dioxygenase|nr:TauD/TfdA family dioxygenase [Litorivicinus sp.]|tara:strand:+ start:201 stop:1076 length:876 start_codon:yes stop_codon:yes gene_type:complete